MTRGRPAREDEEPRFGSVWKWMDSSGRLLALGLDGPMLVALDITPDRPGPVIERTMFWRYTTVTLTNWNCIDEGPE